MQQLTENVNAPTKIQHFTFSIQGMTCESCVNTIQLRIATIPGVATVKVNLKEQSAMIAANRKITLYEVRNKLIDLPKYSVREYSNTDGHKSTNHTKAISDEIEKSWWQVYKPLLVVFAFVFLVSGAYQLNQPTFSAHLFMNHLMAGFFIGLSFFKFLDLKSFAEAFATYDPAVKKMPYYGYIYPFIELSLGLLFVSGMWLSQAHAVTIVILTTTTFGVIKRLQSKTAIQCACLGTAFSLPLSWVTVTENLIMIAMATFGLLQS